MAFLVKYDWEINDCQDLSETKSFSLFSPSFIASPDEIVHRWRAWLRSDSNNPAKFQVLLILIEDDYQYRIHVKFNIKIFDKNYIQLVEKSKGPIEMKNIGNGSFNINRYGIDSIKKISFEMELGRKKGFGEKNGLEKGYVSSKVLGEDFLRFYGDKDSADITIFCGEREFNVHKHILMARSSVFNAMFKSDMIESTSKTICLHEIPPEAMTVFLQFLYSGAVTIPFEEIEHIIDLSEKYNLQDLKRFCISDIKKNTTVISAVKMLILADKYSLSDCKSQILRFIKKNLKDVRESEAWKTSMKNHVDLMGDILDQM